MKIEKLVVGSFASNCYIVIDEEAGEGMIIDPGDNATAILESVNKHKVDIKLIVLTHGHVDHMAALGQVQEATGAKLAIHQDEVATLNDKTLSIVLGISCGKPPEPDELLKGWGELAVGNLRFTVIHTPGHSPGGLCLLGEGVLFSGDTLFYMSIGRSDLPGGDTGKIIESIHTKLMILPDDTKVYPGHGPETDIGTERRGNPFLQDKPDYLNQTGEVCEHRGQHQSDDGD